MWPVIVGAVGSVKTFFTSKINIVLVAMVAVLVVMIGGAGLYLWSDYQKAKVAVVQYKTSLDSATIAIESLAANDAKNAARIVSQELRHEQDLLDMEGRYQQKIKRMETVAEQVATIQNIERPEHEKDCPVHPAIVASFNILRKRVANATGDSN